jgi:putative transposase
VSTDEQTAEALGPGSAAPATARQLVGELAEAGLLDDLLSRADKGGLALTGEGGFLPELVKAVLERGLAAELTGHLGYEKGDPGGRGSLDSRNGFTPKTVATEVGDVALQVPRDRNASFEPRLVPKGARRLAGLDEMIISLYAGGMTVRDIQHHLARTLGTELSHETISNITDQVLEEVKAWQSRPLEEIYPVIYLDALIVKVRDGHQVKNKAAHIAVGIDLDGVKHVLGIWVQAAEGAKFWAGVCAELRNRGIADVLIVCCDGLTGFPEAVEATWPQVTVQTCTVHLIRAAMRFVSYNDRKKMAAPGCAPPTGSATLPSICTRWPASSPRPSNCCPRPSMTPASRNSPGPRSASSSAPPPQQRRAATGTSHDQLDKDHRHNAAGRSSSAGPDRRC